MPFLALEPHINVTDRLQQQIPSKQFKLGMIQNNPNVRRLNPTKTLQSESLCSIRILMYVQQSDNTINPSFSANFRNQTSNPDSGMGMEKIDFLFCNKNSGRREEVWKSLQEIIVSAEDDETVDFPDEGVFEDRPVTAEEGDDDEECDGAVHQEDPLHLNHQHRSRLPPVNGSDPSLNGQKSLKRISVVKCYCPKTEILP